MSLCKVVEDGKLFTWGRNGKYECGLGHGDDVGYVILFLPTGICSRACFDSPGFPHQEGRLRI